MSDPLIETLALDLTPALDSLDGLNDVLTEIATGFGSSLAEALAAANGELAQPIEIEVEADTDNAQADVDAISASDVTVPVDADTDLAQSDIDALDSSGVTVPVEANTEPAADEIAAIADDAPPVEIPVVLDTADAEAEADGLASSLAAAGGAGEDGAEGLGTFEGAAAGVSGATSIATGDVAGIAATLGAVGPRGSQAAGGILATVGALSLLVGSAVAGDTATQRLNDSLGEEAARIEAINIPGFANDLSDLAVKTGNSDEALRLVDARIADLGLSAGATNDQVAQTVENIDLLAIRLSVVNPTLGDAGQIADSLTGALARGGRALAPFGIGLSSAEIEARALLDTGKKTSAELTIFERSAAGAALAAEQLGDKLRTDIVAGADKPEVKLRALRAELEETIEALGAPLVAPVLEVLEQLLPVAGEAGRAIATTARIALPFLQAIGPLLVPVAAVLSAVNTGLEAIADTVENLDERQLALIAVGLLGIAVNAGIATGAVAAFWTAATGPIGIAVAGLAALGFAYGVLGDDTEDLKTDTAELGTVFATTSDAADGLGISVTGAADAVDRWVASNIDAGDQGTRASEAMDAIGLSAVGVRNALTGTREDFESLTTALISNPARTNENSEAFHRLFELLNDGRAILEANATATLNAAVAQGLLTEEQINAAIAADPALSKWRDEVALLKILQPTIDAAAAARSRDAAASEEAAAAYARLRQGLLDGTITAEVAKQELEGIGLSAEDAAALIDGLTQAMDAFVSTALSALPEASAAVTDFTSGITDAYSALVNTATSGENAVASAQQRLADASSGLTETQRKAGADYAEAVRRANDDVATAQREFNEARNEPDALAARDRLNKANADLIEAQRTAGDRQAEAIRGASATVSAAQAEYRDAQAKQAEDNEAAKQALIDSLDPNEVINQVFEQAVASAQFIDNLNTILAQGNARVFQTLAAQGPENAGLLAQSLVDKPELAKKLEGALTIDQKVKQHARDELTKAGKEIVGTAADLGTTLAGGITAGFAEDLDFATPALKATTDFRESAEYRRILAQNRFYGTEIGAAFSAGVDEGMRGGQDAVDDAAEDMVDQTAGTARYRGRVRSPSGLFMEIGEFMAEGFAIGIDNRLADVALRGQALVDAASPRGSLAIANRGPSGVLNAAPAPGFADGGGAGGGLSRADVDRLLSAMDEFARRKNVDVKVESHHTDPDPHHLSREIAWNVSS